MSLIYIGRQGAKKIFVTAYCQKRLQQRNLSAKEVLYILAHREVNYPTDVDGRQKIRSTVNGSKKAFLTVFENRQRVIVITGGEA